MKTKTNKKYFWLKLKEDFFDDKQTRYLRSLPDGDKVVITYLKMQLKSLKTEGTIRYDCILPTCEEELALMLDEDINIVKFTIKALQQINAIEILEDNTIYMIAMQELIGKESASAERVRKFRENKVNLLQCNTDVTKCNTNVTKCNTEIDIEINKEIEKEIEQEIEKEIEIELNKEINIDSELPKEDLSLVVEYYEKNIGKMDMNILKQMYRLIQEGTTVETIIEAMKKAVDYNGKSWGYVCTILENKRKKEKLLKEREQE